MTTLYAAGFLAYGLENQALAAENLTREDAEKLRALLLNEYFDESVAKIQIYEHLMPINHRAFVDAGESQRFLRQMMRSKGDFIATFDSIDMPGMTTRSTKRTAPTLPRAFASFSLPCAHRAERSRP